MDESRTQRDLTIAGLCEMAYATAEANGWHSERDETVTPTAAKFKLAKMSLLLPGWAETVEVIREGRDPRAHLREWAADIAHYAGTFVPFDARPVEMAIGRPMAGSRTQILASLTLMATEIAEAVLAASNDNWPNFREELADLLIRAADTVQGLNVVGHHAAPIDLAAEILAKDARNRTRGHRHGGKLA